MIHNDPEWSPGCRRTFVEIPPACVRGLSRHTNPSGVMVRITTSSGSTQVLTIEKISRLYSEIMLRTDAVLFRIDCALKLPIQSLSNLAFSTMLVFTRSDGVGSDDRRSSDGGTVGAHGRTDWDIREAAASVRSRFGSHRYDANRTFRSCRGIRGAVGRSDSSCSRVYTKAGVSIWSRGRQQTYVNTWSRA